MTEVTDPKTSATVGDAKANEGQPPPPSKAVEVAMGIPLRTLAEAKEMARTLAVADTMPKDLRGKAAETFAIIAYGRELGLAPMQAIQSIYVVKGKPQMSADLWTAFARRAGHKVRWGKCDDQSATVTIIRRDDPEYPHTRTYTIDDAIQAGLCTRDEKTGKIRARSKDGQVLPWEAYTPRMLMNRAISFAGKAACPEVALGFGIEGDYDYIDADADPVTVPGPEMHGPDAPMSPTDAQQAVAEARQSFAQQDIVDAEVVEDQGERADGLDGVGEPPRVDDPERDLFAKADEQADQDLNGDRDE